ncbi:reverse transcriptase (RNA-dependent DNA polymerase) [Hirsutella rhossiliensis]
MGNRPRRSTEVAVHIVAELARTAWDRGGVASLLQLDLKGAFDSVDHTCLLQALKGRGIPEWLLAWIRSFVSNRTARLLFDGDASDPLSIHAGVPQGSPLSPILFLFYIAPLYDALEATAGTILVGFADDSNILAFGRTTDETAERLEGAWSACEGWARAVGAAFEPAKSELLHFTRAHAPPETCVRLGNTTIAPSESSRFLGVWLHRKLQWGPHLKQIQTKFQRQRVALTALAASAWGCRLSRAREIYTKVIRSAIVYGGPAFHTPTPSNGRPRGVARALCSLQTTCLRTVAGAYKATPTRSLETETEVPPLDLYLNERLARFQSRLETSGMAARLRLACAKVSSVLRKRKGPWRKPGNDGEEWQQRWCIGSTEPREALWREWTRRWERELRDAKARHPRRALQPSDTETPPPKPGRRLKAHADLYKHESSTLIQLRTGKIGLNSFLYHKNVPSATTPLCRCGGGEETVFHVFLRCPLQADNRRLLPGALRTDADLRALLMRPDTAPYLVRWFLNFRPIPHYKVAADLARSWTASAATTTRSRADGE